MSAETLRRAASLMRSRAKAATPGPWQVGQDVDSGQRFIYDERWTELAEVAEWSRWLGNPQHIASWHPAVALAVADWLDRIGEMYPDGHSIGNHHALAVARAYLGESS